MGRVLIRTSPCLIAPCIALCIGRSAIIYPWSACTSSALTPGSPSASASSSSWWDGAGGPRGRPRGCELDGESPWRPRLRAGSLPGIGGRLPDRGARECRSGRREDDRFLGGRHDLRLWLHGRRLLGVAR